jgi:hypothetical protein
MDFDINSKQYNNTITNYIIMLLSELEDLENILDDIVADDMGNILTKDEECECVET